MATIDGRAVVTWATRIHNHTFFLLRVRMFCSMIWSPFFNSVFFLPIKFIMASGMKEQHLLVRINMDFCYRLSGVVVTLYRKSHIRTLHGNSADGSSSFFYAFVRTLLLFFAAKHIINRFQKILCGSSLLSELFLVGRGDYVWVFCLSFWLSS